MEQTGLASGLFLRIFGLAALDVRLACSRGVVIRVFYSKWEVPHGKGSSL